MVSSQDALIFKTMNISHLALSFFALSVVGCVSTDMSTYIDPNYVNQQYDSVVVHVHGISIRDREVFESQFQEEFAKIGVSCQRFIDLVPPTQSVDGPKAVAALKSSGAEAFVHVYFNDIGTTSTYVPPTYSTYGTVGPYNTFNATTYQSGGGYDITKLYSQNTVSVMDIKAWDKVSISESSSDGNAFAELEDIGESLAKKTVAELVNQGVIRSTSAPKKS